MPSFGGCRGHALLIGAALLASCASPVRSETRRDEMRLPFERFREIAGRQDCRIHHLKLNVSRTKPEVWAIVSGPGVPTNPHRTPFEDRLVILRAAIPSGEFRKASFWERCARKTDPGKIEVLPDTDECEKAETVRPSEFSDLLWEWKDSLFLFIDRRAALAFIPSGRGRWIHVRINEEKLTQPPPLFEGPPSWKVIRINRAGQTWDPAYRALQWLARHQHHDGSWLPSGYVSNCPGNQACLPNPGSDAMRIRVTAISLLAFLGGGFGNFLSVSHLELHEGILLNNTARHALSFLLKHQDEEGWIGNGQPLSHRLWAALALLEAHGLSRRLRKPAERAFQAIVRIQNADGGWGDGFTTSLALLCHASARNSGLPVNREGASRGLAFLKKHQDPGQPTLAATLIAAARMLKDDTVPLARPVSLLTSGDDVSPDPLHRFFVTLALFRLETHVGLFFCGQIVLLRFELFLAEGPAVARQIHRAGTQTVGVPGAQPG